MLIKWFSVLVIVLSASVYIFMSRTEAKDDVIVPKISVYSRAPVYLGAWAGGFWDSKTKTLEVQALKDFEQVLGKKVAIANLFSEWTYLAKPDLVVKLDEISDEGWIPMISSNPLFFDQCPKGGYSLYKTIASGACDEFLGKVAINFASYEKPVMLRFAWEMNLPNMYWSIDHLNSTPDEFIAAWRHFHDVMQAGNATNVIWVLSFNTSSPKTVPYEQLYPGDEYVDWVAIDGYNWGTAQDWSNWNSFRGVFRRSYEELVAITDKPVMLSEVNSASQGGDRAKWFDDMLNEQVPNQFPKIQAVVFFNENKEAGENVNWRIDTSVEVVEVVRKGLDNSLYVENYP